jgi:hypothetical protein
VEIRMTEEKLCPADYEPCHVVALVSGYIGEVPEQESIWECLPCNRCRVGLSTIRDLKGTRLGRHERRILLSAAGPEQHPKRIAPEAESRSAYEALQRARRKLEGARIIEVTEETPVRVRLSPAGQAVRQELRGHFEAGKPVRWTQERLASIARALGPQDADFLFLYFIETLKEKAERWGLHLDRISRVDPALGERFRKLKEAADTVLGTIKARQKERWDQVQTWLEERRAEENDAQNSP